MANLGIVSLKRGGEVIKEEPPKELEKAEKKAKKGAKKETKKGKAENETVKAIEKPLEIVGIVRPAPVEERAGVELKGPPKGLAVKPEPPKAEVIKPEPPRAGVERPETNEPPVDISAWHYRAVGVVYGKVLEKEEEEQEVNTEPEEKLEGPACPIKRKRYRKDYVIEINGQVYPAFSKKKELARFIKRNIGQDCNWKVYPWYQIIFEDGKPIGKVLGFELCALITDPNKCNLKVEPGLFSIRGVISECNKEGIKVKVFRNDMVNDKTLKAPKFLDRERTKKPLCTRVEVKGTLPPSKKRLGWFWDIEARLQGDIFVFLKGRPEFMIHEVKKPERGQGLKGEYKKAPPAPSPEGTEEPREVITKPVIKRKEKGDE